VSVLAAARRLLDDLEQNLAEASLRPNEGERLQDQVRAIRELLSDPGAEWIGTTEAKRLLGLKTEHTVRAWAKAGVLRSRTTPNGRTLVSLEDVLRRVEEGSALTTPWDAPLSPDEAAVLSETRPGSTPWRKRKTPPK
jgi:hypothetical protein